jgi:hypothetical protein
MAKNQQYGFTKTLEVEFPTDNAMADQMIKEYEQLESCSLQETTPKESFYISTEQWEKMLAQLKADNADGFKIIPSIKLVGSKDQVTEKSFQLIMKPIIFNDEVSFDHQDFTKSFYWTIDNPNPEPPIIKVPTNGSGGTDD